MINFLTLLLSLLFSGIHSSRVHRFSIEKTDKLKAALRSGEPWAIGCLGLQKDQDANTNSMLDQLSNALDSGKKFKDLPDKVQVGSVNCKGKLPSGKSLKSKYKLSSQKGIPTFFFVGNGRQPKQLKVTDFTSKDKKDKTKLMLAPTTMARYVTKAAKPTVVELTTDVQLKQNCLKDKSGAIVLLLGRQNGRSKKLSKSHLRLLTGVMRKNRSLRVCTVDLAKHVLHLPKEISTKVLRDDEEGKEVLNSIEASPPQVLLLNWGPTFKDTKKNQKAEEKQRAKELKKKEEEEMNEAEQMKLGPKKKFGMYRHLNERSKQWESKDHNSKVSMSMCRHLMHDQMDRNEGRRVFEEHRVTLKQLTSLKTPESKFTHHQALFRVQGRYYTWETAGEFFLSFFSLFFFFFFLSPPLGFTLFLLPWW